MKIGRDVRKQAKTFFRACFVDGRLDEKRVKRATEIIAKEKPRHVTAILTWFKKLVELEIHKNTVQVDSATPLPDEGSSIFKQVEDKFGPVLAKFYNVKEALVGGLRIQVGSNVWDGSIRQRLNTLKTKKF
jgi:F-type H+-transporting ATPase subunit delta